jgi:hypothetical protein
VEQGDQEGYHMRNVSSYIDGFTKSVQGYILDYQPSDDVSGTGHYFCGPHAVIGASCPNCHKPLLRFLALNTEDRRLNLQDSLAAILSLFFCWTCNVAQKPFFYRILADRIDLLGYGQGGVVKDFPYDDYPVFFPGATVTLHEILTNKEKGLILRHQIGGEPLLIQPLAVLECPLCGVEMPFLASIADDCLDIRGIAGDDGVQVIYEYCRRCHVVGAYQRCD